jgi:hypothetical protein
VKPEVFDSILADLSSLFLAFYIFPYLEAAATLATITLCASSRWSFSHVGQQDSILPAVNISKLICMSSHSYNQFKNSIDYDLI